MNCETKIDGSFRNGKFRAKILNEKFQNAFHTAFKREIKTAVK